ncbi:MAG: hypothetical protein JWM44_1343 [Bacilli bacterium]|nr:hypothetical protein [Bacilli bacterium]
MSAIALIESQRKEMHAAIKKLLKTGELELLDEDIEKAEYLLHKHPIMDSIIRAYEHSQKEWENNGLSQYALANAEGNARREHGREQYADVTANSVVLADKSDAIYTLYKTISNILRSVIDGLKDNHEREIFHQLFIEGKRSNEVVKYMERGYHLYPIGATTAWEKRRRALKKVAASLKLAGVLEVVKEDERESRIQKKVVYRIVFEEWDR